MGWKIAVWIKKLQSFEQLNCYRKGYESSFSRNNATCYPSIGISCWLAQVLTKSEQNCYQYQTHVPFLICWVTRYLQRQPHGFLQLPQSRCPSFHKRKTSPYDPPKIFFETRHYTRPGGRGNNIIYFYLIRRVNPTERNCYWTHINQIFSQAIKYTRPFYLCHNCSDFSRKLNQL